MSEPNFAQGQRVTMAGRLGTVRFCGGTKFAAGVWVGIELDDAVGKNSGTVQDVEYFRCPPEHGIFVRPPMVQVLEGDSPATAAEPASPKGEQKASHRTSTASSSAGRGAEAEAKEKTESPPVEKREERTDKQSEADVPEASEAAATEVAEEAAATEHAEENAEKALAEKIAADKAAADKAAADKAAAEKAAADKAAAEKAAAEKAAADKAAADKAAAEKAAAEMAAAEKAAADREAAEKAAAEQAAAQKASAEKAERTAQDQAKRAQEASAAQLVASKAQAAAEAELRSARQEVTRLKNDIERAKTSTSSERERLQQMKWRREQALQQMEQLAKTDYGDVEHSEEVIQAQAEMRRAAEAAEKLRSELNQKKNNVSTMMMIRSKLKKKVENVQDQSQLQAMLQEKLDASILARLMAEERLEELKLELAEAELKREEEAEEKARLLVQMVNVPTPGKGETPKVASEDGAMAALMKLQNLKNRKEEAPEPPPASEPEAAPAPVSNITRSPELDSYQEALRVLHQASQQEVAELQKQIAVLDQDSNKVPKLKTDQRALTNRQNLLQERMADLETEAVELEQTAKAGDELLDLRDSVVHELRQEVEQREERLRLLEDLVLKLDKERQHLKEEAERDASDAKDLFEEVMKLTNGEVKGPAMTDTVDTKEVHRRLAVASVHHRLAQLDLATAKAKGSAFADCVPRTWQGEETPASESLTLALAQGGLAKAAERILFRLEGIGRQADECGRGQTKLRMEMCEVACVAFRCAAAMASVLDAGLGEETSIEVSKALEAKLKRVEQTLKELMHKKWPLDSPSQALNGLQEVDSLIAELSKSTSSSKTSTRGFCYQFQRFQVAFAYGIESKTAADAKANAKAAAAGATAREPAEPVKVAEEDGAMAALMRLQNRNKKPEAEEQQPEPTEPEEKSEAVEVVQEREREQFHEEQWPEIELRIRLAQRSSGTGSQAAWETEMQRLGKAIEVGLSRCATGGEEEPSSFWRALKSATDFFQALPPSETRLDLLKKAEEVLGAFGTTRAEPMSLPASLEVQSRVEEIDEKQREVREAQERLKERKKQLTLAEEDMLKAEDRGKNLKTKLSAMIEANETSDALQAEEEKLRLDVTAKAQSQAQLAQQFDATKAKREKLERLYKDAEKKRKQLEESIDKMRQRPKQDEDGRATAPEFVALKLSQKKGARELYALQMSGAEELLPLPESEETTSKTEDCLQKYSTLRKNLLKHLSTARVQRLGVRDADAEEGSPFGCIRRVFAHRLQELHFQLSEARSSLNDLGETFHPEVKKPLAGQAPGTETASMKMALRLDPPRWAQTKVPKRLYTSSWSEIREIHVAAT